MIRFLRNLLLTLWLAFLVAVAVESHRPASLAGVQGLDPVKGTAPDLLDRMEQSMWHRNAELNISETDVNHYIAATISGSQKGATSKLANFDRVALHFQAAPPAQPNQPTSLGRCTAWFRWTSFGVPCTASIEFTIRREKTLYVVEPVGGSYGRLPVFRGALAALIPACRSLTSVFEEEIKTLFQMNQITFVNNKVVLEPRFDLQR